MHTTRMSAWRDRRILALVAAGVLIIVGAISSAASTGSASAATGSVTLTTYAATSGLQIGTQTISTLPEGKCVPTKPVSAVGGTIWTAFNNTNRIVTLWDSTNCAGLGTPAKYVRVLPGIPIGVGFAPTAIRVGIQ